MKIITKERKCIDEIGKIFLSGSTVQISTKLNTSHPLVKGIQALQIKGHALFEGGIITEQRKCIDEIGNSSSPEPLGYFEPNLAQSILG